MVKFAPSTDIPPLTNKTILVTGGNIGLGRETIFQLVQHNPSQIYLAARNEEKALAAIEQIKKDLVSINANNDIPITYLPLDLQSFSSIKSAAQTILNSPDARLDILINNAGIMLAPAGVTQEGYESHFGTNHIGHALFTRLLIPLMQRSDDARIIFVSSMAENHAPSTTWTFETMKTPDAGIGGWARYAQSKLANIHYARALAVRYPGITTVSVHPGIVHTNILNGFSGSWPWFKWAMDVLSRLLLTDVRKGALCQLWAATAPKDEVVSGAFYCPVGVLGKDSVRAKDEKLTEELWEWTEVQLKAYL